MNSKNHNHCFMHLLLFPWMILLQQSSHAQEPQKILPGWDELFIRPHIAFTLTPGITQKAAVTEEPKLYGVRARHQLHGDGGFTYWMHYGNKFSVATGLHMGVTVWNFEYRIPAGSFQPLSASGYHNFGPMSSTAEFGYISAPLWFEKRWLQQGRYWNILAGVNFRYATEHYTESNGAAIMDSSGWGSTDFFELKLVKGNRERIWLNYNLGGGYAWRLRNFNIFKISLLANLSMTDFITGTYLFTLPANPEVNGSFRLNGSYIGISCSYVFTKWKKTLQKLDKRTEL